MALNLHGLHSGLERIFAQIAENINDDLPQGEGWHKLLLAQMKSEIPGIRPAVISNETWEVLDDSAQIPTCGSKRLHPPS